MGDGEAEFLGTERFQVLSRIGEGGMGVVYQALDRSRDARVALKTLRTLNGEGVMRFKNEFRALADLAHPNLVSLGELFSEDGLWFFTMELIHGLDFLAWVRPGSAAGRPPSISPDAPTLPAVAKREPWTPAPATCDEPRLRAALIQLARGLGALHDAQKVHRDIKPSNVLVTREGRVVLLDFGFATDLVGGVQRSEAHVVGTVDYMAPEQAAALPVGPAADWYSVGVVLYQGLTGQLPFDGPALEVLMRKQKLEPRPPHALVPGVARDLDELCVELLRLDPGRRPGAGEVLRRLGAADAELHAAPPAGSVSGRSSLEAPPFVGRRSELETLEQAFTESQSEAGVTVLVHGESGVGKSHLVRSFTDGLATREPEPVVLVGRCYQRESVPYKALDGVIDALSRWLARLPRDQTLALVPRRAALLAQVFPVLRRVEAVLQAPAVRDDVVDRHEQRQRVFRALREMLARIAERHPLVLVIDDLQWADADSLVLLGELMRPRPGGAAAHEDDAPGLLLIATVRTRGTSRGEAGAPAEPLEAARDDELEALAVLTGDVRRLEVESLPADQATELAALLMRRLRYGGAGDARASAIAEEARGHPLFIDELVRHAAAGAQGAPVRLDEALWTRIQTLDRPARELLEMVAVAGGPLVQEVAASALAVPRGGFIRTLALLRVAQLVRTSGARSGDGIEPYHDRVRSAVLANLNPDAQRERHQRLALALETAGHADPEALLVHWQGAGEPLRAAHYAALAASQAADALAFDRAARLYRAALDLEPASADAAVLRERRAVMVRLGDALANAGRGGESAQVLLSAAEGATAADALDLKRRAAEQLLISGHVDQGLAAVSTVLAEVGMKLPRTPRRALASLLMRRARVRLRGIGFRERDASQVPADELRRIDICWSVALGLSLVDTIRGADFQTRNLLLSLQSGEPYRIARALTSEAGYAATGGTRTWKRTQKLVAAGSALAQRIGHPHALGLATITAGIAQYVVGDWRGALTLCEEAGQIFRERCTGVAWEGDTVDLFTLWCLAYLGEYRELAARVPDRLRAAQARGDLFAVTQLRTGLPNLRWLVVDDPEGGRRDADEAMRLWSREGFHLQHFYDLIARTNLDLYTGRAAEGLTRIEAAWPAFDAALLTRIQLALIEFQLLRARLSLAAALEPGADPVALARKAAQHARAMRSERVPWAAHLAELVDAGVASLGGRAEAAVQHLTAAATGLDQIGMHLHAAAARRRHAALIGGADGEALARAGDAVMEAQTVRRKDRITAMLAPGFRE